MLATPDLNGLDTALRFFEAIYDENDLILLRRIASWTESGEKKSKTNYRATRHVKGRRDQLSTELRRELIESAQLGENCYFGVCPRFGGNREFDMAFQVRTIRVLWADLDHCSVEAALAKVAAAKLPTPSIVVNSGNGVHLYWLLDQPYLIDDAGDPPPVLTEWQDTPKGRKARKYILQDGEMLYLDQHRHLKRLSPKALYIQGLLEGIAKKIGGDHTKDVSRLLRIPGSFNRKEARNGTDPKETVLVECDPTRRYSLAQFGAFAQLAAEAEREDKIAKMPLPESMKLRGKKQDQFHQLVAASRIAPLGKRSQADFALCCFAIRNRISEMDVWASVKDIGKFAEGANRYFELTWTNAQYAARCDILEQLEATERKEILPPPLDLDEEEEVTDLDDANSTPGSTPSISRTTIVIQESTPVYVTMAKITERLRAAGNFYNRADHLVSIRNGRIQSILETPHLIGQINSLAEFYYIENRMEKYKPLSTALANTWLNNPDERCKLRPLNLFSHNPVYTNDWRLLAPGYDEASGIYYSGAAIEPREGRHYLDRLLMDFCFKSPCDRTNYIGMLLTAILVPHFIGSKPALLLNGNQPGLGKSVLAQLVAILRDGAQVETATFNSNDEEFEKRLASIVLRGSTTVVIDNAKTNRNRKLESPSLERSITDPILAFRYLGKSASIQTENSHIFCITANAPDVSADLVSRSLIVNLEHEGDPRRRKYTIANPEEFALVHRQEILAELCGMVEVWKSAGMRMADVDTRFNKRDWGKIVGGILDINGEPDFLDNVEETAAQIDETRRDFSELVTAMVESEGGNWKAVELVGKCESLKLLQFDLGEGSDKSKQTRFGRIAGRYVNEQFDTPNGTAVFRRDTDRNGSLYRVALVS